MALSPLIREAIINIERNVDELLSGKAMVVDEKQRKYILNINQGAAILLELYDSFLTALELAEISNDLTSLRNMSPLSRGALANITTSCYLIRRIPAQLPLNKHQISIIESIEKNQQIIIDELERWMREMWGNKSGT